jgi:hypothetical protein
MNYGKRFLYWFRVQQVWAAIPTFTNSGNPGQNTDKLTATKKNSVSPDNIKFYIVDVSSTETAIKIHS